MVLFLRRRRKKGAGISLGGGNPISHLTTFYLWGAPKFGGKENPHPERRGSSGGGKGRDEQLPEVEKEVSALAC